MYREAPIKSGNFDYVEFTRILKHGKKDKDDDWVYRSVVCNGAAKTIPHKT